MTHHRISPDGQMMGRIASRLAELGRLRLEAAGLGQVKAPMIREEMCKTCACRPGTVPNGCLQTQLDFLKAVVECERFLCHSPRDGKYCTGWIRARAEHAANPLPAVTQEILTRWEYSPPDEDGSQNRSEGNG